MTERYSSNSPFEPLIGFSRAVKAGNLVFVSGTAGRGPDGQIANDDYYLQTKQALANIAAVLAQAGASMSDVVRTRIYIGDMANWEPVGRAHREAFGNAWPASTLVQVTMASPEMLVEIEADAVIS